MALTADCADDADSDWMIPIIEEKCTEWDNGVKVFLHGFKSVAKKFHDYWSDCEVPEVLERGLKQRLSVVPFNTEFGFPFVTYG